MHSVKIGVIPLGKENNFFKRCFPDQSRKLPARSTGHKVFLRFFFCRMIGEATRTIIEGNSHPLSIMKLRSQEGNTIYGLQQARWGIFKDAYNRKDRFVLRTTCHAYHFFPTKFLVIWTTTNTNLTYLHGRQSNSLQCVLPRTRFYCRLGPRTTNLEYRPHNKRMHRSHGMFLALTCTSVHKYG